MAAEATEEQEPQQRSSDGLEPIDEGGITIPDDDPEDEEEPKLTRTEKKRLRYDEARREAEEARREADMARMEAARERQAREDYERRLQAIEQRQQQTEDPLEAEIKKLEREEQDLYRRKPATKEEADQLATKAFELRRQQNRLIARHEARAAQHEALAARQQMDSPLAQAMRARYPEVFSNQQAFMWARAREQMILAETGQAPNAQVVEQALKEASQKLRGGDDHHRRDPSDGDRARYSGTSRGGSGQGEQRQSKKLTKQEFAMARAARPDLEPLEAAKHFMKHVKGQKT